MAYLMARKPSQKGAKMEAKKQRQNNDKSVPTVHKSVPTVHKSVPTVHKSVPVGILLYVMH